MNKKTQKETPAGEDHKSILPFSVILFLAFAVPLIVLPNVLDNAFNTPKTFLMVAGVSLLILFYAGRYITGKQIPVSKASTPRLLVILVILNVISFFYTDNYYYTKVAALVNVTSLAFFYIVSLYVDGKKAFWILLAVAFSGVLISIITYMQFVNHFVLFPWARPETMVMGTIGNSNYVGAYFLFPLFALSGLIFLIKGKYRLIPLGLLFFVFGAFLFSRARASWLASGVSVPLFLLFIKMIYGFSVSKYIKSHPKQVFGYAMLIVALIVVLWWAAPSRLHSMMRLENWTETKTLQLRMKYFRASWWLFKQSPLFGTGLWSYRNRVYDAQAEINRRDPSYFKDYDEPKPRRVHNEYLETLNDGGLVAAFFLSLFLGMVMIHGWSVMRDKELDTPDRVLCATAFSTLIAILTAAVFFFPFRVNSTLFLTALMMGLMEGLYLKNRKLVVPGSSRKFPLAYPVVFLVFLMLVGVTWFGVYKPFRAEVEYLKYKRLIPKKSGTKVPKRVVKKAEAHILRAISWDPTNSQYTINAARLYHKLFRNYAKAEDHIDATIINFNGDLTKWSIYFTKGLVKFRVGSLFAAREAFQKAVYYNPNFPHAKKELQKVEDVLKKHDKIMIKLR